MGMTKKQLNKSKREFYDRKRREGWKTYMVLAPIPLIVELKLLVKKLRVKYNVYED